MSLTWLIIYLHLWLPFTPDLTDSSDVYVAFSTAFANFYRRFEQRFTFFEEYQQKPKGRRRCLFDSPRHPCDFFYDIQSKINAKAQKLHHNAAFHANFQNGVVYRGWWPHSAPSRSSGWSEKSRILKRTVRRCWVQRWSTLKFGLVKLASAR